MDYTSSASTLAVGSGLSVNIDAGLAAEQACEQSGLRPGQVDLALVFVSGSHTAEMEEIAAVVRSSLEPTTLIGVSAEGVIGGSMEIEKQPAVSVFAAGLPNTSLHPFLYKDLPHVKDADPAALEQAAQVVGARRDMRAILFFGDPFSVPAASAVDTLTRMRTVTEGVKRCPVIGGLASAAAKPGGNTLLLNDRAMRAGGIGLTIRGDIEIDCVVSQGCRPIGKPLIVTGAQRNVIKTLGGQKALDAIRDIVSELPSEDREQLNTSGLFIGRVIDEYKPRFGRGDFLIRGVLGVDQPTGSIAVSDLVRPGQTVQLHIRDARTASEDLELLLAAQQLHHPPAGGLLFTCNGRGSKLFNKPGHDASAIARALGPSDGRPLPLAGFFAAGEIGPVGQSSFLHGHTASLALLRPRRRIHGED